MPDTSAVKTLQSEPRARNANNGFRRRLWETLKQHGPATTARLSLLMGDPLKKVSQQVSYMVASGVLTVLSSGRGGRRYAALDATYEDARRRRAVLRALERAKEYAREVEDQLPAGSAPAPICANLPRELDHFTVAQLRALRDTLNNLFSDLGPKQ